MATDEVQGLANTIFDSAQALANSGIDLAQEGARDSLKVLLKAVDLITTQIGRAADSI